MRPLITILTKCVHTCLSILLCALVLFPSSVLGSNQLLANQPLSFPSRDALFDQDDRDFTTNREGGQIIEDEAETEGAEREISPPKGNLLTEILPQMLNWAFYLMSSVLIIVLVFAALQLLLARGDETKVALVKRIIIDVVLGAAVTGLAYALITGLISTLANL